MRSAYRAAGQADMRSYNLGVRLVRNADSSTNGTLTAKENVKPEKSGNVLIVFFSWGGNTKGIAQEIQQQTGADIVELTPVKPYPMITAQCLWKRRRISTVRLVPS